MVRSKEFDGFVCDGCGKPYLEKEFEGIAWQLKGNLSLGDEITLQSRKGKTLDFCGTMCLLESIRRLHQTALNDGLQVHVTHPGGPGSGYE